MWIIKQVESFVLEECMKPTSSYWIEPFEFHFKPVVKYANKLVDELWGDREIVTIAAWLHDIWSIINGRKDHHISWSEIASQILQDFNYPSKKIELVKKCILNHRGSQNNNRTTLEEKIIAEADTLSNFENISWIFKAAFVYENLDQWKAKIVVRTKLENKYKQLHFEKSKELIKPKYDAMELLFA